MSKNQSLEDPIQKFEHRNIIYLVNDDGKTVSVKGYLIEKNVIIIPRSINYKSKDYIVTRILMNSFKDSLVTSLIFSSDSEIHTIEKRAFNWSKIESITIPPKLKELQEEWCLGTPQLTKLIISPENPYFKVYGDDKIIIRRTSIENENFNELVFCPRDIELVTIPNFIEKICSCAFSNCTKLHKVVFQSNSNLKTIDKYAFSWTQIEKIKIPSHVTFIGVNSFSFCEKLRKVEFENNSELQIIDKYAFNESSIESIEIPSNVIRIGEGSFWYCPNLKQIKIEIDCELQVIEKKAFYGTKIESIAIPSKLRELQDEWCDGMSKLNKFILSQENPYFKTIEGNKVIIGKLTKEQDNYNQLVFCNHDIKSITIPTFIERICSFSFALCKNLQKVEIECNSKLQSIGSNAFRKTPIESIRIPSQVTVIDAHAFCACEKLKKIFIAPDSKLQIINECAFEKTSITSILIPPKIIKIDKYAFCYCNTLQIIEFSEDFENSMLVFRQLVRSFTNGIIMIPRNLLKRLIASIRNKRH